MSITTNIIREFLAKKEFFFFFIEGIIIRIEDGELARVQCVYMYENEPYAEYNILSNGHFVKRPVSQLPIMAAERIADSMEWRLKSDYPDAGESPEKS